MNINDKVTRKTFRDWSKEEEWSIIEHKKGKMSFDEYLLNLEFGCFIQCQIFCKVHGPRINNLLFTNKSDFWYFKRRIILTAGKMNLF